MNPVEHLRPDVWEQITRTHVRKILAEFAHERLIHPVCEGTVGKFGIYSLRTDDPEVSYRFRVQRSALDHWDVEEVSIERWRRDVLEPLDSLALILELRESLEIDPEMLPTYLEELSGTLASDAYKVTMQTRSAEELAHAEFQAIETSMTAGHPCFVAANGRIGFDGLDDRRYTPEAATPLRLIWLAAHCRRTTFTAVSGLTYEELVRDELGDVWASVLAGCIEHAGFVPDDYYLFPVHPWQWANKLTTVFAGDLARGDLLYLGESLDRYQPQQSIRTLFNLSHPRRHYVKTALSILNMGFMRGLSPNYMEGTPAINEWVDALVCADPHLRRRGFRILREVAALGYRQPALERGAPRKSPHLNMLAALFRESPVGLIGKGQRLMTMAALLHIDHEGKALVAELVTSHAHGVEAWLRSYFGAYLEPLLHCFYAHDMVFMPHGENVILVLEEGAPVRIFLKDIAEEVALFEPKPGLPTLAQRIVVSVPEDVRLLSIFTDVFDCFFRFLAPIVAQHCGCPEPRFWALVAECIERYQNEHSQLQPRFERYDLFAPTFKLSCLNRLQLRNNRQLIDLADPAKNLRFAGELENPIAIHRSRPS